MARPRFAIPIEQVITLSERYGVAEAAERLNVSRHYIYKALKREGYEMGRVIRLRRETA